MVSPLQTSCESGDAAASVRAGRGAATFCGRAATGTFGEGDRFSADASATRVSTPVRLVPGIFRVAPARRGSLIWLIRRKSATGTPVLREMATIVSPRLTLYSFHPA